MLQLQITGEIEAIVNRLARELGVDAQALVERAVLAFAQDDADLAEAQEIVRRIDEGKERTYSAAEVEARLGLGD